MRRFSSKIWVRWTGLIYIKSMERLIVQHKTSTDHISSFYSQSSNGETGILLPLTKNNVSFITIQSYLHCCQSYPSLSTMLLSSQLGERNGKSISLNQDCFSMELQNSSLFVFDRVICWPWLCAWSWNLRIRVWSD